MIKDDTLWKGILENVWDDFLRFMFKDADHIFDMERSFEFLDKELEDLFPATDNDAPKFVDKLVKVFTRTGKEEWILVHVEVQGYHDKDFALRMFRYFYRILDRYGMPVTAVAIFTDRNKKFHPKSYKYSCLGTSTTYSFNTYKIIDQDEVEIEKDDNPFAIVILTVLLALKKKKLSDDDLLHLKLQIFRNLYQRNVHPSKTRGLHTFLNLYVHFASPETSIKFEEAIQTITENKKTMGIEEFVLERAKKQGLKLGIDQGIEKNQTEVVKQLIVKTDFDNARIADIAGVSIAFVENLRK